MMYVSRFYHVCQYGLSPFLLKFYKSYECLTCPRDICMFALYQTGLSTLLACFINSVCIFYHLLCIFIIIIQSLSIFECLLSRMFEGFINHENKILCNKLHHIFILKSE